MAPVSLDENQRTNLFRYLPAQHGGGPAFLMGAGCCENMQLELCMPALTTTRARKPTAKAMPTLSTKP